MRGNKETTCLAIFHRYKTLDLVSQCVSFVNSSSWMAYWEDSHLGGPVLVRGHARSDTLKPPHPCSNSITVIEAAASQRTFNNCATRGTTSFGSRSECFFRHLWILVDKISTILSIGASSHPKVLASPNMVFTNSLVFDVTIRNLGGRFNSAFNQLVPLHKSVISSKYVDASGLMPWN